MVNWSALQSFYKDKKVFVTGHTGFKGSWLIQILSELGAIVKGYALEPEEGNLFELINGEKVCHGSVFADIRDQKTLRLEMHLFEPDIVFHLAAQPLVLDSYQDPLYTFDVNVQGTAEVLESMRHLSQKCIGIMVTTDKVYENNDGGQLFAEDDKLGGYDPYSASKAACEIVISSYRNSFFNNENIDDHQKYLSSVRAGNVIGGGDFAANRIVPDIIRSIKGGEEVELRNPTATRPWQHVLEPLGAYLYLAMQMDTDPAKFNQAFNIGPEQDDVLTVEELTKLAIAAIGKGSYRINPPKEKPHEAALLMLDISKVKEYTDWKPKYRAKEAIEKTIEWYLSEDDAGSKCRKQILEYFAD